MSQAHERSSPAASPNPIPTTDDPFQVFRADAAPASHEAAPTTPAAESHPAAERGVGYLIALLRTRSGPKVATPKQVLRSATAQGSLSGRTPYGQPADPGVKAQEAEAVAQMRAAALARKRALALKPSVLEYRRAGREVARVGEQLGDLMSPIAAAEHHIRQLDDDILRLTGELPTKPPLPTPDKAEWPQIAEDAVPGYRLPTWPKLAVFTISAGVEAVFTGAYVSAVASIGIPGLPVEVNVALPWVSGCAVGMVMPIAAERAAHAAATAEADAPWYVRRAPEIAIAVPAALGVGRAIAMTSDDALSGVLGLGIALLLVALAVVAAAIGFREGRGVERDARRGARARLRAERMEARTPGPSPEEQVLAATKALRAAEGERLAQLRSRQAGLATEQAVAVDRLAKADGEIDVEVAASGLDATGEAGLAVANSAVYAHRRNAIAAATVGTPPPTFDGAAWPKQVGGLPRLTRAQLLASDEVDGDAERKVDDETEGVAS